MTTKNHNAETEDLSGAHKKVERVVMRNSTSRSTLLRQTQDRMPRWTRLRVSGNILQSQNEAKNN